jgi:hypothetical protein
MRIIPSTNEDNRIVDAESQSGNIQGDGGPSPALNENHIIHEDPHGAELERNEEQGDGIMDVSVTSSSSVDWMGSRMESTAPPFTRLSEDVPISPSCAGGVTDILPQLRMESDFTPFSFHPHRFEALDGVERLLGILDMALEIVNSK